MATVREYAELSNAVYEEENCRGWDKLDIKLNTASAGFKAVVYQNTTTQEIVIAIAGTNNIDDLLDDKYIVTGRKPPQFEDAIDLYNAVVENENFKGYKVSATGHSLGGACATYIASQYDVDATTFNAPGIGSIVGSAKGNVQEYLTTGDFVATTGEHIGQAHWYCPVGGMESLTAGNIFQTHSITEQWIDRRRYDAAGNPTNECKGEEEPEDEPPDPRFETFKRVDPIILDLNNDGKLTSAISKSTNFDHDGNGFAERTAWIANGDGLLVWDRDGNGSIDSGRELFGDQTILANGNKAANGFAALAELGKNRDGKIDAKDAVWSQLRVWVDDGDGISQENELKTLDELGIKSLNLNKVSANTVDEQGNTKLNSGTFTWADGTTSEMSDYLLQTNKTHSVSKDTVDVSDEIKELAYLPGYGVVRDSWQIMMKESDGKLRGLIESFTNATDNKTQGAILDQIIFVMTGVTGIDPGSRGGYINGQKLAAMEKVYAEQFNAGRNPNSYAANLLDSMYDNLKKYYSGWLVSQTYEKALFDKIDVTYNTNRNTVNLNFSRVKAELESRISTDFEAGKKSLENLVNGMLSRGYKDNSKFKEFCQYFISKDDALALAVYAADRNIIAGGSGRDTLNARSNKEMLVGGAGNDILEAHGGDTVLYGGAGNDELRGCKGASEYYWGVGASNGNVTYLWNKGDGNDTIINAVAINNSPNGGHSQINLGVGITLDDLQFKQSGDSAQIVNKITGEVLTIKNWFYHDDYKIDRIVFSNGDQLSLDEIKQRIDFAVTEGNDRLIGGNYTENILDGGIGDDYLEGGRLNDIYVWGRGYGHDVINNVVLSNVTSGSPIDGGFDKVQLKPGLTYSDLTWVYYENDLVATIKDTGETLTFKDWYANAFNKVDVIEFADGSKLTPVEIDAVAVAKPGTQGDDVIRGATLKDCVLNGEAGNDTLYGNNGNDTLYGGSGNDKLYGGYGNDILDGGTGDDYLEGGAGNDTYIWGRGYGNDTINNLKPYTNSGDIDILQFTTGLTANDLTWKMAGNDLIITIKNTGETLTIKYWYADEANMLNGVNFENGSVMTPAEINAITKIIQGTEADDTIRGGDTQNNTIMGGRGNDRLYGGRGNDILDGGVGEDYLVGGLGDDTYIWGRGYGNDTINNVVENSWGTAIESGADVLQLTAGLTANDLMYKTDRNNLIITIKDTGETLTLTNWYADKFNMLDSINFADGTIITAAEINEKTKYITGTAVADTIYGGDTQNEIIKGMGGNDKLYGGKGNDILDGGKGDDYLEGGYGDDTYIWGRDYGNDIINNRVCTFYSHGATASPVSVEGGADILQLTEGLTAADLVFRADSNNLIITIKDTGESLTLTDWFESKFNMLDYIKFADGSILTNTEINNMTKLIQGTNKDDILYGGDTQDDTIMGGSGNDELYGGGGNDILDGGTGNDYLVGGAGNDTYIWGRGYGNDTINNYGYLANGDIDKLQLTDGLTADDLVFTYNNNDLIITIKDSKETLTITNWYANKQSMLHSITFADGTVLTAKQINDMNQTLTGTAGDDTIYGKNGSSYIIYGGAGNDKLYGGSGDDILDGGSGNDQLEGGQGNDTYIWGRGYGNDTIYNRTGEYINNIYHQLDSGVDKVQLTDGLTVDDLIWESAIWANGYFIITIKDTGEKLTIVDWGTSRLNTIHFTDGTVLTLVDIENLTRDIIGTAGPDSLNGHNPQGNIIKGMGGDDVLSGGDGNDVLDGGTGNDLLAGGLGDDTYIWGRGYGSDTIQSWVGKWVNNKYIYVKGGNDKLQLTDGLSLENLIWTVDGSDLLITIKGAKDSLRIKEWYSDKLNQLSIVFADGTTLRSSDVESLITLEQNGTNYSDVLYGQDNRDDVIDGLAGNDEIHGKGGNDILYGNTGNDTLYGDAGNDILEGGSGNDNLYGGTGNDVLYGGIGNDKLYGENGDDILEGGEGDDYLEGGNGSDTYIWGRGYGNDRIVSGVNSWNYIEGDADKLQLIEGITSSDLTFKMLGNDLIITIKDTSEMLTLSGWYANKINQLESINFADGTQMTAAEINELTKEIIYGTDGDDELHGGYTQDNTIYGGAGNDVITGGGNDIIYGGDGNDIIYSYAGNDVLDGGAGDDLLDSGGYAGSKIYIWGRGYDNDTVVNSKTADKVLLKEGIVIDDLAWRVDGTDFVVIIKDTGETLTLKNWFGYGGIRAVGSIEFADGTKLSQSEINEMVLNQIGTDGDDVLSGVTYYKNTLKGEGGNDTLYGGDEGNALYGGAGDDKLYGGYRNDILDGGTGDDYLEGGDGNDTYIWGRGYGNDTINNKFLWYDGTIDYSGTDILQIKEGLTVDDLIFRTEGKNLAIIIKDTGEKLTLLDWYIHERVMLDSIQFADGTILKANDIHKTSGPVIGTDGDDILDGSNTADDIIYGEAGNDFLYGHGGNDILYGGTGNDKLYGGDGNDLLDGGEGSDYLEGGAGNDTYIWGRGYGNTSINNVVKNSFNQTVDGGYDVVRFKEGLTADDLTWRAFGNNLIAKIKDTGRELTFTNWFASKLNEVDRMEFADGTTVDIAAINEMARTVLGTDADNNLSGGDTKDDTIYGYAGNDKLYGKNGDDTLYGGLGDDVLYGDNDNDKLYGEEGNDQLYGDYGNDLLDGGTGDDYLEGGLGDDIYIWGRGYGNDTINNTALRGTTIIDGGVDKLQLTTGMVANDLAWSKDGNNLIATIKDTGETLTFTDWYANPLNMLDSVNFSNGTILIPVEIEELTKLAQGDVVIKGSAGNDVIEGGIGNDQLYGAAGNDTIHGGVGNDTLYGEDGNDVLYGDSGNDILYGGNGDDTIDGGAGDDYLEGGAGDDTYIWGRGQGSDTINNVVLKSGDPVDGGNDKVLFKAGLSSNDLSWKQDGNNLIATIRDSGETLTFSNWYANNMVNRVDSISFADGTTLTAAQVQELTKLVFGTAGDDVLYGSNTKDDTIQGEAGNDQLYGYGGNDTLDGGSGNDYLEGGLGNDTYIWGRNYGNDTINNVVTGTDGKIIEGGRDTLQMAAGVVAADIIWRTVGNDLVATIEASGETLTFTDWYANKLNMLDSINFADGTILTAADINAITQNIHGTSGDDILQGGDTQDDIIDGAAGNDILSGGLGDDTYIWGRGYGNDVIHNAVKNSSGEYIEGGADKLQLSGLTSEDIEWIVDGQNLIIKIKDSGETLVLVDWYLNKLNMLDSVQFADGTILTAMDINSGLTSYITGTDGNDTLYGMDGRDDIIKGEGGNDIIYGYGGNDELYGGAGNDKLYGGDGNDILDGGLGMDTLEGGAGDDIYIWGRGYMNGTINNVVRDAANKIIDGGYDTVRFKELTADDLTWRAFGNNLIAKVNETGRELTFINWYANSFNEVDRIEFADGTTLDIAALNETLRTVTGTDADNNLSGGDTKADILYGYGGNDKLYGKNGNDILYGGEGEDMLYGENDNDTLYGESGNDQLYGGAGNDILDGGAGEDYLEGGAGNDTYIWGRNYGNDTINNVVLRATTPIEGGADIVQLNEGLSADDLIWTASGNNLIATIQDSGETLTFTDWYANKLNMVDSINFADGTKLTATEINELVTQPTGRSRAAFSSIPDMLAPTGYQIDITDTCMQQIACATIAFDGEHAGLGCAGSNGSMMNAGLDSPALSFASDSLTDGEARAKSLHTGRQSIA